MGDKSREDMAVSVKERIASWGKAPVLVKKDLQTVSVAVRR